MEVRASGRWMTTLDELVLESLQEDDYVTLDTIVQNINSFSPKHVVNERLRVLSQAGYVEPEKPDRSKYELTVWGKLYLEGEVRADLLHPEPSPMRPGYILG